MILGRVRRWQWLALAVTACCALAGGGYVYAVHADTLTCTMVGGTNVLSLGVPVDLRSASSTIRVALSQDERSRRIEFVPESTQANGRYVEQGVVVGNAGYAVYLGGDGMFGSSLGGDWQPGARATVTVEGVGTDGRTTFRHEEAFSFDRHYPNGKECDEDDPYLSHHTEVPAAARL